MITKTFNNNKDDVGKDWSDMNPSDIYEDIKKWTDDIIKKGKDGFGGKRILLKEEEEEEGD